MGKHHKKLLNNLEKLRKSAGLTQQELSESAGVSRVSINGIENGVYVTSTAPLAMVSNIIVKFSQEKQAEQTI